MTDDGSDDGCRRPRRVDRLRAAGWRSRRRGAAAVSAVAVSAEPVLPLSWPSRAHASRASRTLVGVDGSPATTLVAEAGGRIVAFAGYHRDPDASDRAEVAFAVADAVQGHGIGTRLLEQLAEVAREAGHPDVRRLRAGRQPPHARRVSQFRACRDRAILDHGVVPCRAVAGGHRPVRRTSRRAIADRGDGVDARVLRAARGRRRRCQPRARQDRLGDPAQPDRTPGFTGTVVPVHPTAPEIGGLPAYRARDRHPRRGRSGDDRRPRGRGPRRRRRLHQPRTSARSASSAPASANATPTDAAREAVLVEKVRRAGCRLIGPNCMGLLNTDPAVRLNATFSPVYPPRGNVAMSTQSGALGLAILDYAQAAGHRHLELRLGRQQGGRLGQRPDSVLGRGPRTVGHPAVSRELRQPEEVQRDRPPRRPNQADRGGEGRTIERRDRGPRPRTPARWPRTTSSSMRCSGRPASSGPSGSRRCSTSRRCSRISRFRAARASRS